MTRGTEIPIAFIVAVMAAAVGLVATDRALAAELNIAGMRLTSSDATARFVPLGLHKSVVIDLPTDIEDVLVADPKTVNAVVRSKRRVYIIGLALGETDVYFYGQDHGQIGALDIAVVSGSPQSATEINPSASPANVIVVFRGDSAATYSCTSHVCIGSEKPDTTQYSQQTIINKHE